MNRNIGLLILMLIFGIPVSAQIGEHRNDFAISLDALNQIHSVIETGDGESWLCHHHRLMEPALITALKRLGLC